MGATNAYAAKRAIIDRLAALAASGGGPLAGVQVAYSWPGKNAEMVCVYLGRVTFEHPADEELADGPDSLPKEVATIGLHISVAQSPPSDDGVRDTDIQAEEIGDAIGDLLMREPRLAGGHSIARIAAGEGDYIPTDDQARSVLTLRITVESYVEGQ
jgi:hypothetical protein